MSRPAVPLFGPLWTEAGCRLRLWAPSVASARLIQPDRAARDMAPIGDGFFEIVLTEGAPGDLYMFRVDGRDVADPASRMQAEDAEGWSVLPDRAPPAAQRAARPWHEAIIVEVHVGTASESGDFAGLAERLGEFVEAGYTAIELMPIADFAGGRNWGYDGVLPFAPDRAYGTPASLRALVATAHAAGLAILLDVVYNHFGPAGNYLPHYAADFFDPRAETPWGAGIAFGNPTVCAFFAENALMWLTEYGFDGLRFDAVHAFAPPHGETFLMALAERLRAARPDAWLVLENDDNAARLLARGPDRKPLAYTAQWNDDIHHALHVLATGEQEGYYRDYAVDTTALAARALTQGFAYQGEASAHRDGRARGEPTQGLPPEAFVAFAQNHDQIGNRPRGDRLAAILPAQNCAWLRFLLLLAPQIPLFFMGEEWGATEPFPYFCDFAGDLAEAVRRGRAREFAAFHAAHADAALPDALDVETFRAARLPPPPPESPDRADFARLVGLRRRLVWPLTAGAFHGAEAHAGRNLIAASWHFANGDLHLAAAAAAPATAHTLPVRPADAITGAVRQDGNLLHLEPWSAAAWAEHR